MEEEEGATDVEEEEEVRFGFILTFIVTFTVTSRCMMKKVKVITQGEGMKRKRRKKRRAKYLEKSVRTFGTTLRESNPTKR